MNKKLKRALIITASTIVIFIVIVILFISPLTKYLIEKYDEKFIGRQVKIDWVYVNPFTGYAHFNNFRIFESKSDSVFFSSSGLSVGFSLRKMLSETYEINELTFNDPWAVIVQNKKEFNFDDIIRKFSPKEDADIPKEPVHFNLLNIKINNGEFHYVEKMTPVNYFIKKVNFKSAGKVWNSDTLAATFSFVSGMGTGEMKGDFMIDIKKLDYRIATMVNKFDMTLLEQYVKDMANYGSFRGSMDATIKAKGNFKDKEDIHAKGLIVINDFHFGKTLTEDYAAFDKLIFAIDELSPKDHIYMIDSVSLTHPYFKYERYDHLDNLQNIFGRGGANIKAVDADPAKFNLVIEIARYIKVLAKNFLHSSYKVNKFAVYKGDIKYCDFSLSEKFTTSMSPLTIIADSINKNHKRVKFQFTSGIKPYGNAAISISINPKDSGEFDLNYTIKKMSATMFNPYTISYTSFPLDRGTIEFKGNWTVRNGEIQSDNHMLILDPRIADRLKNDDIKRLPLPLIMFFVRERGNVIDYEIPITGNLKDPKFRLRDVIFDVLENIFVKPVTIPYRVQVKKVEEEIEKTLTLKWEMRQHSFEDEQKNFIEKIVDFLKDNKNASIEVYPQIYAEKEKEYILFFEAKKKYFLASKGQNLVFSKDDSLMINGMSVKDSVFVRYLNKQLHDSLLFTIQDKCSQFVGSFIVDNKLKQLNAERERIFNSYFKKDEVAKRVKLHPLENTVPYNGFSFYKIHYKGELPKYLYKAYAEMNGLNNKPPRKKFKEERKKNKHLLKE